MVKVPGFKIAVVKDSIPRTAARRKAKAKPKAPKEKEQARASSLTMARGRARARAKARRLQVSVGLVARSDIALASAQRTLAP